VDDSFATCQDDIRRRTSPRFSNIARRNLKVLTKEEILDLLAYVIVSR